MADDDLDRRIKIAVLEATQQLAENFRAQLATAVKELRQEIAGIRTVMIGLLATTAGGALLLAFNILAQR